MKEIKELRKEELRYYDMVIVLFEGEDKPREFYYETVEAKVTKDNLYVIELTDYISGILTFYEDKRPTKKLFYGSVSELKPITHYELVDFEDEDEDED